MPKSIADQWFDPFRSGDLDGLAAQLADEFVHASPFGEIEGKKAYIDLVAENQEAFFDQSIEIVDVIEAGDKAAVRYKVSGRPACDCIYVKQGKIVAIHAYYHLGEEPTM